MVPVVCHQDKVFKTSIPGPIVMRNVADYETTGWSAINPWQLAKTLRLLNARLVRH